MVVVPRHRRGFVTDDGLHDVERNTRIRRERDERVPQGVECRLRRPPVSSFEANRGLDVRRLEDARKLVVRLPPRSSVQFRDHRQNRP